MLPVTAGIIRRNGKILLAKRRDDCPWQPNRWEFPGGKIEEGESPEECLMREIKEELGIDITIDKHLTTVSHIYKKDDKELAIRLMTYLADWKAGEVKNLAVKESVWVEPTRLKDFEFAEADKEIIKLLMKNE